MTKLFKNIKKFFNRKVLILTFDSLVSVSKDGGDKYTFKKGIIDAIRVYNPKCLYFIHNVDDEEYKYMSRLFVNIKNNLYKLFPDMVIEGYFASKDNEGYGFPNPGLIELLRTDCINGTDFYKKDALLVGNIRIIEGKETKHVELAMNAGVKFIDDISFVKAMNPCVFCVHCMKAAKGCDDHEEPTLPCLGTRKSRLKENIIYKP